MEMGENKNKYKYKNKKQESKNKGKNEKQKYKNTIKQKIKHDPVRNPLRIVLKKFP